MKKATILIHCIVCPRNMVLKIQIKDFLIANGWTIVPASQYKQCDMIVFCSCGFSGPAKDISMKIIGDTHARINRMKNPPLFVVTGCFVPIARKEVEGIHDGPCFGCLPNDLKNFDALIDAQVKINDVPVRTNIADEERVQNVMEGRFPITKLLNMASRANTWFRRKYYQLFSLDTKDLYSFDEYQMGERVCCIITSTGCYGKCSYCVIRLAKGRLKSRPISEIVETAEKGVAEGKQWVSLVADDNGVYGKDIGTNLAQLLTSLTKIKGDFNILIDSVGPLHFLEMYDELMGPFESGRINRLLLTIQHVNKRILDSMNRPYDVELFKKRLEDFTARFPDCVLDMHVMPCYPGETEEEFQELIDFLEWYIELNPLNEFKVFLYTKHPNALAAKIEGHIPRSVVKKRMFRLMKLKTAHSYKRLKIKFREIPQLNVRAGYIMLWGFNVLAEMLAIVLYWNLFRRER